MNKKIMENMKKRRKNLWKRIGVTTILTATLLSNMTVYAGGINAAEQRIISFYNQMFYYNGKLYVATESAKASAYAKLAADGVDLTDSEASNAIRQASQNVKQGIDNGVLVEYVEKKPENQDNNNGGSNNGGSDNSGNNNSGSNNNENDNNSGSNNGGNDENNNGSDNNDGSNSGENGNGGNDDAGNDDNGSNNIVGENNKNDGSNNGGTGNGNESSGEGNSTGTGNDNGAGGVVDGTNSGTVDIIDQNGNIVDKNGNIIGGNIIDNETGKDNGGSGNNSGNNTGTGNNTNTRPVVKVPEKIEIEHTEVFVPSKDIIQTDGKDVQEVLQKVPVGASVITQNYVDSKVEARVGDQVVLENTLPVKNTGYDTVNIRYLLIGVSVVLMLTMTAALYQIYFAHEYEKKK